MKVYGGAIFFFAKKLIFKLNDKQYWPENDIIKLC